MTRETLKEKIDEIFVKELNLSRRYFNLKENGGEDILLKKELMMDNIKTYMVLSKVEEKLDLLVNDTPLHDEDITYGELIDIFYNEYLREKRGY